MISALKLITFFRFKAISYHAWDHFQISQKKRNLWVFKIKVVKPGEFHKTWIWEMAKFACFSDHSHSLCFVQVKLKLKEFEEEDEEEDGGRREFGYRRNKLLLQSVWIVFGGISLGQTGLTWSWVRSLSVHVQIYTCVTQLTVFWRDRPPYFSDLSHMCAHRSINRAVEK